MSFDARRVHRVLLLLGERRRDVGTSGWGKSSGGGNSRCTRAQASSTKHHGCRTQVQASSTKRRGCEKVSAGAPIRKCSQGRFQPSVEPGLFRPRALRALAVVHQKQS